MKPVNVPPSAQIVNDLSGDLFADGLDVETVLSVATKTLSRVRVGTWLAIVMCGDIVTSRVVVADDSDPKIADYISRYIASVKKPGYAPTTGLSQQVIDSGEPILLPNVPAERFVDYMTPAAREWLAREAAPMPIHYAGLVIVPMRANPRLRIGRASDSRRAGCARRPAWSPLRGRVRRTYAASIPLRPRRLPQSRVDQPARQGQARRRPGGFPSVRAGARS